MNKPAGLPDQLAQLNHTAIMGVLNVTPDSFSDGGLYDTTSKAIAHGLELMRQGSDIIDVGGESTRPGASRVSHDEELSRVIPVVEGLVAQGASVSIDTMRAGVAEAAVQAGAILVNDVSGGLADEEMLKVVATLNVPYVMMHWRAHSTQMNSKSHYTDVVADVISELRSRIESATAAGIKPDHLVLDPGIGFAKLPEQNWPLLSNLPKLTKLGFPLLVGASRKRFLGELLADNSGPRNVQHRDFATTAITTVLAEQNVWAVRVHNVQAARDAVSVVQALRGSSE
jgi:dihydropteroate synthase